MSVPTDTWITIAESDILASLNNSEFQTLITTALASMQPDPTTVLIPDVTEEVRGYVRGGPGNVLGAEGTVPRELKNAAIDILLYRLSCRVSNSDMQKAFKPNNDLAIEKLEKVAKGIIRVSAPLTLTTTTTSAPSPQIGESRRHGFGYEEERGL